MRIIKSIYNRLYGRFGPQSWWPGDTRLEIIVGAILTQNTAWSNVEKAIANLKDEKLLSSPGKILKLNDGALAERIRPAGYYNVKAARVKNFLKYLDSRYDSSLRRMASQNTDQLRKELLDVSGIGPETCDSILLYAFNRPIFVVDAYTKRIFSRHNIISDSLEYHDIQKLFMGNLPSDREIFNEYHALIVRLAKTHCKFRPRCDLCPLKGI